MHVNTGNMRYWVATNYLSLRARQLILSKVASKMHSLVWYMYIESNSSAPDRYNALNTLRFKKSKINVNLTKKQIYECSSSCA